jgi:uncharacterized pyridoxamine 5'-phosphate oxidase family protein
MISAQGAINMTHQKIHDFLKQHPMGILSTVSADGTPWGAAIYYVSDDDFNFFFVTKMKTLKYQNLDNNPLAALTIADPETQITVQAMGKISRLPIKDYADVIFAKLAKIKPKDDHTWVPPITKVHEGDYIPLRLTPSKLQFADYKAVKSDIHASYIEKII